MSDADEDLLWQGVDEVARGSEQSGERVDLLDRFLDLDWVIVQRRDERPLEWDREAV